MEQPSVVLEGTELSKKDAVMTPENFVFCRWSEKSLRDFSNHFIESLILAQDERWRRA